MYHHILIPSRYVLLNIRPSTCQLYLYLSFQGPSITERQLGFQPHPLVETHTMQNSEVAPDAISTPPVGTTHASPPSPTKGARPGQLAPSDNPYFRLAIVAGILLPIATVPYLLSRRRISRLQFRCEELEWKLNVIERRLSFNVSESSNVRTEQDKMRTTLHNVIQETAGMQQEGIQRAAEQGQTNQSVQSDLQKLVEETKQIR